ncbi:response regulator [Pseudorhodobacter sp. W20_MBD10_FR17]|uniref:response regulator n=1 Tax=Pseudorhodobacter sp. W20_MBD10_FR17 TaxID=3240266 RepID=UPI003F98548C
MDRILVIEDDPKICSLLQDLFNLGGYDVRIAGNARDALKYLKTEKIDLVTLDLQLGSEDGLDVARSIRKTSDVPIIMVTGRDDVLDRVVGLEIGADDYITKPFHVREVLARVRSVLRRVQTTAAKSQTDLDESAEAVPETSAAFRFDDMVIIPDQFELFCRDGTRCELTSGDFKLLKAFLKNPKRVLSRDHLMDLVGGVGWSPLDRTIDNQVARLRKKIERDPTDPRIIKTVRGIGYSFACEVTEFQLGECSNSTESSRASLR